MKKIKCIFLSILIILSVSCKTRIAKIHTKINKYDNKTVKIKGSVVASANVLVLKYFKVKDRTGEIFVVTKNSLPTKGEKIKVKGTVKQFFKIGKVNAIVIKEENMRKP